MVKANTPGKRDGRIAFWIDGALAGDFTNLRLRDVDTLKANQVSLGLYTKNGAIKSPCTMWYDDVVVATSYIGPMARVAAKKSAREELKAAGDLLAQGDLGKAYQHLETIALEKETEEVVAQVRAKMKAILDLSWKSFEEAQTLESIGEKADAIKAYQEIIREFPTMPVASAAKAKMDALKASSRK
jgi:hypothetical protein